jgi:hypothetical protein
MSMATLFAYPCKMRRTARVAGPSSWAHSRPCVNGEANKQRRATFDRGSSTSIDVYRPSPPRTQRPCPRRRIRAGQPRSRRNPPAGRRGWRGYHQTLIGPDNYYYCYRKGAKAGRGDGQAVNQSRANALMPHVSPLAQRGYGTCPTFDGGHPGGAENMRRERQGDSSERLGQGAR